MRESGCSIVLRQFFWLGASVYFWLSYLGKLILEVEKSRFRRKAPIVAVFTVLVLLIFLEDAIVMLLVAKPVPQRGVPDGVLVSAECP